LGGSVDREPGAAWKQDLDLAEILDQVRRAALGAGGQQHARERRAERLLSRECQESLGVTAQQRGRDVREVLDLGAEDRSADEVKAAVDEDRLTKRETVKRAVKQGNLACLALAQLSTAAERRVEVGLPVATARICTLSVSYFLRKKSG